MKKLFIMLASAIALCLMAIWLLTWLSWQPQTWYSPPDYTVPEVKQLAERAEYRLNEEFHKVRSQEDVWKIRITDEAMNAWLAGRLEGWLTHDQEIEMPPEIKEPQIHATVEGIWFGAMVDLGNETHRPVALQLWAWIDEGQLFVEPIAIRLGKIPIPVSLFTEVTKELQNNMNSVEAVAPLLDDRVVAIQGVTFETGALILTCQTQLPQK